MKGGGGRKGEERKGEERKEKKGIGEEERWREGWGGSGGERLKKW